MSTDVSRKYKAATSKQKRPINEGGSDEESVEESDDESTGGDPKSKRDGREPTPRRRDIELLMKEGEPTKVVMEYNTFKKLTSFFRQKRKMTVRKRKGGWPRFRKTSKKIRAEGYKSRLSCKKFLLWQIKFCCAVSCKFNYEN